MKIYTLYVGLVLLVFISCNYTTYTPRSKKNIQREKPSVVLLNSIIDFRTEQNLWPVSKEDFINRDKKYRDAFNDFPYTYTQFKVADDNSMTFYFSGHKKDQQQYDQTQKVDLNSYAGRVKFYKEKDKFVWKLKMY